MERPGQEERLCADDADDGHLEPTDDRVVVDAGSKSMSFDLDCQPVPRGRDDIAYVNTSEEHG